MKKLILAMTVILSLGLTACSTVEGLGKDIQNLGGKIEKSSK